MSMELSKITAADIEVVPRSSLVETDNAPVRLGSGDGGDKGYIETTSFGPNGAEPVVQATPEPAARSSTSYDSPSKSKKAISAKKKNRSAKNSYSPRKAQQEAEREMADGGGGDDGEYLVVTSALGENATDADNKQGGANAAPPSYAETQGVDVAVDVISDIEVTDVYTVNITKNAENSFGVSVSGGLEFNELPVLIINNEFKIAYVNSGEEKSKILQSNDVIVDVNGTSAVAMTHNELIETISGHETLTLGIASIPSKFKPADGSDATYTYTGLLEASKNDDATDWTRKMAQVARTRIFSVSVPWTTRPKRIAEQDGREYHFKTMDEFEERVTRHSTNHTLGFYEYNQNDNGHYYGSPTVDQDYIESGDYKKRIDELEAVREADSQEATVDTILDEDVLKKLTLKNRRSSMSSFLRSQESDDVAVTQQVMETYYDKTVPLTTRPMREAEKDGLDYHFVTDEVFGEKVEASAFLEHGEHNGFRYGTLKLDEDAAFSVKETSFSRREAMRKAKLAGEATIGQVMDQSDWSKTSECAMYSSLTVTNFLKQVSPGDEKYGTFRKAVKIELSKVTVPYTTRPVRLGELDGEHYHFVSDSEFDQLVEDHKLYEWAERAGFKYGAPKPLATDLGFAHRDLVGSPIKQRLERHVTMQKLNEAQAEDMSVWDMLGQQPDEESLALRTPRKTLTRNISGFLRDPLAKKEDEELRTKIVEKINENVVKCTTRPRIDGEVEGISFRFMREEDFVTMRSAGRLLVVEKDADGFLVGTPVPTKSGALSSTAPWIVKDSVKYIKPLTLGHLLDSTAVATAIKDTLPDNAPANLSKMPLLQLRNLTCNYPEYAALNAAVKEVVENVTVPVTTRPRKMNEVPGIDYHFVQMQHYQMLAEIGHLYESGEFGGFNYGMRIPCEADLANMTKVMAARMESAASAGIASEAGLLPRASVAMARKAGNGNEPTVGEICATFGMPMVPEPWGSHACSAFVAMYPNEGRYVEIADAIAQIIQMKGGKLTTRPREYWELDGREYEFVQDEQFKKMTDAEQFFTFDNIGGDWFGCLKLQRSDIDGTGTSYEDNLQRMFSTEAEMTVGQLLGDSTIINTRGQSVGGIPLSQFIDNCTNNNDHGQDSDTAILRAIDAQARLINPLITTRAPLQHELDNAEFIFTIEEMFEDLLAKNYFMEHTRLLDETTGQQFRQGYLRIFKYEDIAGKMAERADLFEAEDALPALNPAAAVSVVDALRHRLGSFVEEGALANPQALKALVEEVSNYLEVGPEAQARRKSSMAVAPFMENSNEDAAFPVEGEAAPAFPAQGDDELPAGPDAAVVRRATLIAARSVAMATGIALTSNLFQPKETATEGASAPALVQAAPAFSPAPVAAGGAAVSTVDTAALAGQLNQTLASTLGPNMAVLELHHGKLDEHNAGLEANVASFKTLAEEQAGINADLKATLAALQASKAEDAAAKDAELAAKLAETEASLKDKEAAIAKLQEDMVKKEATAAEEKDLQTTNVRILHAHIKELEAKVAAAEAAPKVVASPAKVSPVKARMAAKRETLAEGTPGATLTPVQPRVGKPQGGAQWQRATMMVNVANTISPLKAKLAARRRARAEGMPEGSK